MRLHDAGLGEWWGARAILHVRGPVEDFIRVVASKARFFTQVGAFIKRQLRFDFEAPADGGRRRRLRRQPVRRALPAPPRQHACGVARPPRGTVDLDFWGILKSRRDAGDPQRHRVYLWQQDVLGHLQPEPLLGEGANHRLTQADARAAALGYLAHLWATHARDFRPYYPGIPYLRVGFATALRRCRRRRAIRVAHAVPQRHAIYCRLESLNRTTLIHEVCHLLVWGGGHGPEYCAALVLLWEREFGIDRGHALALATRMNVQVAPLPASIELVGPGADGVLNAVPGRVPVMDG